MPTVSTPSPPDDAEPTTAPRGTFVIVAVFGALVAFGWLALYLGLFLPRATP